MKNKASNKILSLALAAVMVFTLTPGVTVYAEEGSDSGVITAFDTLPEGVAAQTVPLGTSMSALTLPDTLGATVDGAPDSVPVDEWQSEPEYDGDMAGTYVFTAAIPGEYTVADNVEPPVITVTVGKVAPAVTITIAEDENDSTALYLPRGVPIDDTDLLAGVSGLDENGDPVHVTITELDGLDLLNPQMRSEGYPNPPYIIAYAAAHPDDAGVTATTTREVYVTLGAADIMPTDLNTDLAVGTWTGSNGHRWVEFGGILWRVLEVKDNDPDNNNQKTALLLAENSVGNRQFHTAYNAGDGNWKTSDIRAWLNSTDSYNGASEGFLNGTFTSDEQEAIVTSSYKLGGNYDYPGYSYGKDTPDNSKVFLLGVEEANGYFADDADRAFSVTWWQRSPGSSGLNAAVVDGNGYVDAGGSYVRTAYAIRPALKII